jgi:NAD(P)-dependent dehydrogenase (short-subunit alcohol dehydrogenase family)
MARMDLGLRGRVYLVTGGSRGLGFAAAQALIEDGAHVLISAPHEATATAAVALLTQPAAAGTAAWAVADNADPATPGRLIAAARDRFGRLDGALISVGGTPAGTTAATPDQAWRSAFESLFLGAVRLARVLAAELDGRSQDGALTGTGGSVVFVLASSVRVPLPELAISNGLFPGLAGVVKTLAGEFGPAGSGSTGCCRSGSPPTGSASSTPSGAIPMRCAPASPSSPRCAATASPRSSGAPPRSCSPRPRPSSPAR